MKGEKKDRRRKGRKEERKRCEKRNRDKNKLKMIMIINGFLSGKGKKILKPVGKKN